MTDWIWLVVVTAFATVLVGSFTTLALSVFLSEPNNPAAQPILIMFTNVVGFWPACSCAAPSTKTDATNHVRTTCCLHALPPGRACFSWHNTSRSPSYNVEIKD